LDEKLDIRTRLQIPNIIRKEEIKKSDCDRILLSVSIGDTVQAAIAPLFSKKNKNAWIKHRSKLMRKLRKLNSQKSNNNFWDMLKKKKTKRL
jgi:hypothetical protein